MPETIVFHALDLSGETTLKLFLRKADGSLLNAGGDALTEAGITGVFTATLAESRVGLGTLAVRVCLAAETAANLLYDGFISESSLVVDEPIVGGSGGGTATLANQTTIISLVNAALASAVAAVTISELQIVGFPATLQIGDSYLSDSDSSIVVYMRDSLNAPVTTVGTHGIADVDFAPALVIVGGTSATRVEANVTVVIPVSGEAYLLVEFPAERTRRAAIGEATMQCVLQWSSGAVRRTIATQTVEWLARE